MTHSRRQWVGVLASLRPDDRIAIAVSGGSDSVALAWILHDLEPRAAWRVAGLVHVNHGLRGEDSAADELFCRDLAARMGRPIEVATVDVRSCARERKQSIEVAARAARYEHLDAMASRLGATVVATGHTMDDQAETVLLRLLRGAGTRGLSGIRQRRGRIVRPVLSCRRAELREYLQEKGESFREDASNDDLTITRNRLRHEVMPVIEQFSGGAIAALARCAALAADDEAELERIARDAAASVFLSERTLDAQALMALTPAVSRRVVRIMAERVAPGSPWSANHIEAVRALARSVEATGEQRLNVPGTNIMRRGNVITLGPAVRERMRPSGFDRPLAVPGLTDIPEAGATIAARSGPAPEGWPVSNGMVAVLDASAVALPLRVRSRRPGDRLKPLGAPGHRKLQDLLVDRKIPRESRDRVPIVVDAAGRILWVAGLTVAEECRATASGASMVILELTKR